MIKTDKNDKNAAQPDVRRNLPAVHKLLASDGLKPYVQRFGQAATTRAVQTVLTRIRDAPPAEQARGTDAASIIELVIDQLESRPTPYAQVLNATGVLLHTNLGRAPIPDPAWHAMAAAKGYCDVELDLATGKRASRIRHIDEILSALAGAEAATAVNNCAAALLISVAALAKSKPIAISRGHLVEIGGGFRLPTILQASGSSLAEVGTTNRTHLADYEEAIEHGAGAILVVHHSNFVMEGYVTSPPVADIIETGHRAGLPVILDLGSGCLLENPPPVLGAELTVSTAVNQGFDVVVFSGDKLLGGPQAGLIVGKTTALEPIRRHPLARAVRCDKLQLAALMATLDLYERAEAMTQIPLWRMLTTPQQELRERATDWQRKIGAGEVIETTEAMGGGSLPGSKLTGYALALPWQTPDNLLMALREQTPPIIGHIDENHVLLHPRTVAREDDNRLVQAVVAAIRDDTGKDK